VMGISKDGFWYGYERTRAGSIATASVEKEVFMTGL